MDPKIARLKFDIPLKLIRGMPNLEADSTVHQRNMSEIKKVTGSGRDWSCFSNSGCISSVAAQRSGKREIEGRVSVDSTPTGRPGTLWGKERLMMEMESVSESERNWVMKGRLAAVVKRVTERWGKRRRRRWMR